MNGFDRAILEFLNQPALHGDAIDRLMVRIADNFLLKGGFVLAVVWAMWFARPKRGDDGVTRLNSDDAIARVRRTILTSFVGTFVALGLARVTSVTMPFRSRPLNYPEVFTIPPALELTNGNWFVNDSSIPSDHAALFYALATTIFLVSRRAGVFMFIYATVVIMTPRLYLLLHYPTDIIAGAILGVSCVLIAWQLGTVTRFGRALVERVYGWSHSQAPTFYATMFIWSFCIAELFRSVRQLAQLGPLVKAITRQG